MKIKPLGDRVVVKKHEETESKSTGGIYLPDSAKESPQQGEVIAVGGGKKLQDGSTQAMEVKVGDIVVFDQYAGRNTVKIGEDEFLILSEGDIYGVMA